MCGETKERASLDLVLFYLSSLVLSLSCLVLSCLVLPYLAFLVLVFRLASLPVERGRAWGETERGRGEKCCGLSEGIWLQLSFSFFQVVFSFFLGVGGG